MNDQLLTTFIGISAGAIGYWIAAFWMRPILRYKDIRQQVLSDIIFYANAVIADGMSERIKEASMQRIDSNRRHSADLTASYEILPYWYRLWLKYKGHDIEKAARNLIGYSNTPNYDDAEKRVNAIKSALGFKADVV